MAIGDFHREHFADGGRCVFGPGIMDKDLVVASMEQAAPWTEVTIDGAEHAPTAERGRRESTGR